MYAVTRSRFRISRSNRRFLSTALLQDQTPPPPPLPEPSSAAGAENKSWNFLKYSLVAALTGGAATAGYATYVPAKLVELYLDLRRLTEEQVRDYSEPSSDKLLPDLHPLEQHVFTIVLDLSETLVYSDWKRERGWRTFKRPGVEDFLEHLAQFFEIIVYSDQQNMYVDPIVDKLDSKQCIRYRLSRGATKYVGGKHYRDLSMLNRDPSRIIYISGNALESSLQPENCVEIKSWKGDVEDTTLLDLIPFLEYVGKHRPADIRTVLASYQGHDIAKEFIERSKEHHRRMQEQRQAGRLWRR
ncbi:mitochondrial import inner membrane translocase subunit TIM50-like isoform X3 [Solanum stenotomum]|uniref:mitochondrial import inner membrane translocase subunit TIM50-like isoform X3 n=1 Tax=Solanum stenotomum TaxID=172797 RepID=UPI0020D00309|nr:mitochondrial import inner membrane translocase subunit TIM50-like isoform X3 [Solanum stenotomum]